MSQKTNEVDASFAGVGLSNPVKLFTSLPGLIIKQAMFPVCWMSRWDRNGGVSTFIRKLYFGNF